MDIIPCDTEIALLLYNALLATERCALAWQRVPGVDARVALLDQTELRIEKRTVNGSPGRRYDLSLDGKRVVGIPAEHGVDKLFANWCDRVYKTT